MNMGSKTLNPKTPSPTCMTGLYTFSERKVPSSKLGRCNMFTPLFLLCCTRCSCRATTPPGATGLKV